MNRRIEKEVSNQISNLDLQQTNGKKLVNDLPKCFDLDYYLKHQDQCDEKSSNWYCWGSLRLYAKLVRDVYATLIKQLNLTTCAPVRLPNYVENSHVDESIEMLIKQLEMQEANLFQSFNKDSSKVAKKFNKHSTLNELREYGAMCWLMYQNLTRDNFYHAIVDFKTRNQDKDLSVDRNAALLYVGHVKTKNFVKTKVAKYFSTNRVVNPFQEKHPTSNIIYANIETEPLFEKLMLTLNGYNYLEKEEWFKERLQEIKDENAKKVINFYTNYPDVKYVYKKLFNIKKNLDIYYAIEIDTIYFDIDNNKRDFFVTAETYLKQVEELLQLSSQFEEYSFLQKDCLFLKNKLLQALSENKNYHNEMIEKRENAIKTFHANFGDYPYQNKSSND